MSSGTMSSGTRTGAPGRKNRTSGLVNATITTAARGVIQRGAIPIGALTARAAQALTLGVRALDGAVGRIIDLTITLSSARGVGGESPLENKQSIFIRFWVSKQAPLVRRSNLPIARRP
jgi:hypothetical protein